MTENTPVDVELLWDEFHGVVNMTSDEIRTWLLTDASGEDAFPADPRMLPELGTQVVDLLRKRKVDLTREDTEVMRKVVEFVEERTANRPADAARDERWRHALMSVGHDPLKP
ncbi:DUF3140 domain-containing protein [Spirillospora sp. NPDC029432]|uniref:DUF3140 domain-containing protein n=1 Tax=Spirillospora sp. NPDC029432 TaxID=3154599 RepID=UPI003453740E